VTGLIAQHPRLGGVTWDYLQYVLGLAHLGHEVYYFEDSGEWPYSWTGGDKSDEWVAHDPTDNVDYLANVMSRYGFGDRWAYRFPVMTPCWYGLNDARRRSVVASADLVINVSGTLVRPGDYRSGARLAYIDSDPVFTQIKLQPTSEHRDFRERVEAHDMFFSFGERSSQLPATDLHWRATRSPIVLSEWHPSREWRNAYTTVMSWTSYRPLSYRGRSYGQKDREFTRFLDLPGIVQPAVLEVALNPLQHLSWETSVGAARVPSPSHPKREFPPSTVREMLEGAGWRVADATQCCQDLDRYRDYVEVSKAEWSVAKNGYVAGQPGWFSCRSACYLAAGRPVVVQDTGFRSILPTGEGILSFTTMEDAAEAIRSVEGNYQRHAQAARAIAEEYFDSDRVLTNLVEQAMSSNPRDKKQASP
jgi:hypothetical protein